MRCAQFREASSSGRDGEALGAASAVLERHRRSCAGCAAWVVADDALMRTLRMRAAEPVPDGLAERIISSVVLPGRVLRCRIRRLRLALALLALIVIVSAAAAMAGSFGSPAADAAARQLGAAHLGVALGLLVIAAQPRRAAGGLAVLAPMVLIGAAAAVTGQPGWGSASAAAAIALALAAAVAAVLARVYSRFIPGPAFAGTAEPAIPAQRPEAASA